MTGYHKLPDAEKSRRDLLDEIYLLRDVAGERDEKIRSLRKRALATREVIESELGRLRVELTHALDDFERIRSELIRSLERDVSTGAQPENPRTDFARVMTSRFWRLTSPLRRLGILIRRIRRSSASEDPGDAKMADRPRVEAGAVEAGCPATPPDMPATKGGLQTHDSSAADSGLDAAQAPAVPAGSHQEHEPQPGPDMPCLWVDITELAIKDGQTGVQRVVREVLRALLAAPPPGYRVEPVCAKPDEPYRRAAAFAALMTGAKGQPDANARMDPRCGDIFLGLDHSMDAVVRHTREFADMQAAGVRLYFVCNDVLPLSRPDCFLPQAHDSFKAWFEAIATVADGIACISRATEAAVREWLDALQVPRGEPLALGHFHLGADMGPSGAGRELTAEERSTLDLIRSMPSFLMVGTVEPRKGHAQALEAFEKLWAQGQDVALVLVGWPGWLTDVVMRRIRHNDEFGKRLFWFMGVGDDMLEHLYRTCSVLLMPSEGEGFGLPLVEAATRSLPILCRDLPVFREVAGDHAAYFSGFDPASLAEAILDWLAMRDRDEVPASAGMKLLDWQASARQLLDIVIGRREDSNWQPGQRFCFPAGDPRVRAAGARFEHGRIVTRGVAAPIAHSWPISLAPGKYDLYVRGEWLAIAGGIKVELFSADQVAPLDTVASTARELSGTTLLEHSVEFDEPVKDLVIRISAAAYSRVAVESLALEASGAEAS